MASKDNLSKIIEWLRQMNKSLVNLQHGQDKSHHQIELMEKKINLRMDIVDERMDGLSEALQALLKAMKGLKVQQFSDRDRFEKEIHKIKQEIRSLLH